MTNNSKNLPVSYNNKTTIVISMNNLSAIRHIQTPNHCFYEMLFVQLMHPPHEVPYYRVSNGRRYNNRLSYRPICYQGISLQGIFNAIGNGEPQRKICRLHLPTISVSKLLPLQGNMATNLVKKGHLAPLAMPLTFPKIRYCMCSAKIRKEIIAIFMAGKNSQQTNI